MKKILSILTLSVLIASLVLPFALPAKVMAESNVRDYCTIHTSFNIDNKDYSPGTTVGDIGSGAGTETKNWAMVCLFNTIYTATKWIFWILISVSTIMIIIGAFLYMTSQGNENQMKSGKSTIIYAIIGLILAALAKFLPALARFIVGM